MKSTLPAELPTSAVVAVIDTREQTPLDLHPLQVATGTLATGDYSIRGLEHLVAIERKSLSDLLCCIGQERERFERELQRLLAYPVRCVVVESTWAELGFGQWRSKLTPAQVTSSVLGWIAHGIPFLLAGSHEQAGQAVAKLLYIAARRQWRIARQFVSTVTEAEQRDAAEVVA